MKFQIYQVDAFADRIFGGNPAAVVVLDAWLDDATMQLIALENNLSETAFIVKTATGYHLRWFTPMCEVDLCGHATLAAAHIILSELNPTAQSVTFTTQVAGTLTVTKSSQGYTLDFPSRAGEKVEINTIPAFVLDSISSMKPTEAYQARDLMLVYNNEEIVRNIKPDFKTLHQFDKWIIITAKGQDYDCVSRFFCAGDGIDEDPVTGSAHCTIIPYWAAKLGKNDLIAYQASTRGGKLICQNTPDRVFMSGNAITYMIGEIRLPE